MRSLIRVWRHKKRKEEGRLEEKNLKEERLEKKKKNKEWLVERKKKQRFRESVILRERWKKEEIESGLHQRVTGIWSFSWLLWPETRWKCGEEMQMTF